MSTVATNDTTKAEGSSQADNIRSAMSLANLLTEPGTTAVGLPADAPAIAPPSTPTKPPVPKSEGLSSPDAVMSDVTSPGVMDNSADDGDDGEGEAVNEAEREFVCMNDPCGTCQTGQITKDLSRKVISDHFGRNKACTRDISHWPLFCRKHYQRATYNKEKWQLRKIQLINRQFDIIEEQFPGTTYDIHFKKSEETRLNQYSRQVAAGMTNADAEKMVAPVGGKHFEAPIDVLRELDQWLGKSKTCEEVKKVVNVILQMLEEKETEQVPAIEFLPQLPNKSPAKTPTKARTAKSPKTPSRVSTKGAIKKTKQ